MLPKWEERTQGGINLCQSPSCAQSVSFLALNLLTGLVSSQFHALHDDKFETICEMFPSHSGNIWQGSNLPIKLFMIRNLCSTQILKKIVPSRPLFQVIQISKSRASINSNYVIVHEDMPASKGAAENNNVEQSAPSNVPEIRRSSRIRKAYLKLRELMDARALQSTIQVHAGFEAHILLNILDELDIDKVHPIAFAASSGPDVLYLHEAMIQPDDNHFIQAMEEETRAHEDNDCWEILSREDIPINMPLLPAIWSMRRK